MLNSQWCKHRKAVLMSHAIVTTWRHHNSSNMVCNLQRNLQSTFAACFHTCTDTFIKCYSYSLSNTCWLDAMFSLLALLGVLPLPLPGITLLGSCSSSSTASPSYSNNVTWLWHVEHRNTTIGMAAWQARTAIHVTILEDVSRSKKDPTTTDLADGLLDLIEFAITVFHVRVPCCTGL